MNEINETEEIRETATSALVALLEKQTAEGWVPIYGRTTMRFDMKKLRATITDTPADDPRDDCPGPSARKLAEEWRARHRAALAQAIPPEVQAEISAEIRRSGIDGGFYERDDSEYVNVVRGSDPARR